MEQIWGEVRAKAEHQAGQIHLDQLRALGLLPGRIRSWSERGRLIRVCPRVYAVGYVRTDLAARRWAALLYAGPGAYLTGMSAAHLLGLINHPPNTIVVATPHRRGPVPGLTILPRRPPHRVLYGGFPVAPLPELMLQLAAEAGFNLVRKALANLDFRRQLTTETLAALRAVCGRGRRGAATLRRALEHHLPQLAHTNSPLEDDFVILLDAHHLRMPRLNVWLHGVLVDAYWPELKLVVELDGEGNHGTAAQLRRDGSRAERLRAHGLTVLRFTGPEVRQHSAATLARLARHGVQGV